tara:strand:+ start:128 stop:970 length:843 start_codon:yes stop_codon:yes gene_type:complete
MGKRYLDTKKDSLESSILSVWQEASLKQEKLVGGQKKLDKDKDGDIDAKDFAMLRKAAKKNKKEEIEFEQVEEALLDMSDEDFDSLLDELSEEEKDLLEAYFNLSEAELTEVDAFSKKIGKSIGKAIAGRIPGTQARKKRIIQKASDRLKQRDARRKKFHAKRKLDKDFKAAKKILKTKRKASMFGAEYNPAMKEYYEMGTDEYRKHTQEITPGQQIQDYGKLKMQSMKEALAKVWGLDESDSSVKKEKKDLTKELKGGKTLTGKESDTVDVEPKLEKKK